MPVRVPRSAAWLAGLAALALLTACGGAESSAAPAATSSMHASMLALAQCMRQHGVTNFPDPGPKGWPPGYDQAHGVSPTSAAYQSASKVCLPRLIAGTYGGKTPDSAQLLAFAQCVRRHGYPGFPDPTIAAYGIVKLDWQAVGLTVRSPQAQQVMQACTPYLRQGGS
jgi:hypothetical protein